MIKQLCVLCFALSTSFIYAQQNQCDFILSGTTYEEHNPTPLSYAVIRVLELDTTFSSDDEGHYILEHLCSQEYTLVCSFLGFRPDTHTVFMDKDKGLFFTLHPENCELDEVVVSAASAYDVEIIDLNMSVAENGIRAIEEMSGASLLQTGNNTVKPINHGLHSSRLRVVQAGVSIENQQWGEEHGLELSGIGDLTLSDQNNLLYHHDGIGGVLIANPNISVNEDTLLSSKGFLYSSMNSNGRSGKIGGELSSNLGFAPWIGIKSFGSISRGGDVHTSKYNLNNTGYSNYDYGWMLDAKHKKFNSTLFYSFVNQELGVFSGSHIENVTDFERAISATEPDDIHTGSFDYQIEGPKQAVQHELLSYKLKFLDTYEVQVSRQFNQRQEFEGHIGEVPQVDLQLNLTTLNGDLRYYSKQKKWSTIVGVNGMNQTNTWNYREFIPNYEINKIGGYLLLQNLNVKEKENWIVFGLRYDYYNNQFYLLSENIRRNYVNLAYSLEIRKKLEHGYTLSFTNGMSWRPPSANELFSNGVHHGAATIEQGNPDLRKEVSNQVQIELSKQVGKITGSVNAYGNYMFDFIYSQPNGETVLTVKGAFPKYQYVQTNAILYGSDFNINYTLSDRAHATTRYSVIKTMDMETNKALIGITPNRIEQSISFQSKQFYPSQKDEFVRYNWKVGIEGQYFFRRENTNLALEFAPPPSSYVLLNTFVVFQIKNKQDYNPINIRLEVNNIFNTRYRNYMNRYRFFADEMGRNVKLTLEIPFNIVNRNQPLTE